MTLRPVPSDTFEAEELLWEGVRGTTGWDVGAHLGQSVLRMITLFKRVVALEPVPESFAVLERDWRGRPGVVPLNIALSDHDGKLTTSVRAIPIHTGQVVALNMPYEEFIPGETSKKESLPWGEELGTRYVKCKTADTLAADLGHPDFISVDTEGHEVQVLRGASKILAEGRCRWLIEFHTRENYDECSSILADANYSTETVRHPHYDEDSFMWHQHGWLTATPS